MTDRKQLNCTLLQALYTALFALTTGHVKRATRRCMLTAGHVMLHL